MADTGVDQVWDAHSLPTDDNVNPYTYCVDIGVRDWFFQKGKMLAYYGQMQFEAVSGGLSHVLGVVVSTPLYADDWVGARGQGRLLLGSHGFDVNGYDLDDANMTIRAGNLLAFGGTSMSVDGEPVDLPQRMAYKGMMLSGVPNLVFMIGYTNASWTLKVDLVAEYACRLLRWMGEHGHAVAVPERDPAVEERPLLDFGAGYVQRSIHELPTGGDRAPWALAMNYAIDAVALRRSRIDDAAMRFTPARPRLAEAPDGATDRTHRSAAAGRTSQSVHSGR